VDFLADKYSLQIVWVSKRNVYLLVVVFAPPVGMSLTICTLDTWALAVETSSSAAADNRNIWQCYRWPDDLPVSRGQARMSRAFRAWITSGMEPGASAPRFFWSRIWGWEWASRWRRESKVFEDLSVGALGAELYAEAN
jgi:hypothetical protein